MSWLLPELQYNLYVAWSNELFNFLRFCYSALLGLSKKKKQLVFHIFSIVQKAPCFMCVMAQNAKCLSKSIV